MDWWIDGWLSCFHLEEERDERPARRQRQHNYEEPVASRLRREIIVIAENMKVSFVATLPELCFDKWIIQTRNLSGEAAQHGDGIAENFDDDQVRGPLLDTMVEL